MNAQDAKSYIDQLKQEYIDNHIKQQERDLLIAENNIEKRDIKGYHGREILELLQNADDAYQKSIDIGEKPNCELQVSISYLNNILRITNTGTFFDKNGIKAIVQGNNSPKFGKYIGNKGTGFRSILNWANKVRIFSGEFAVEFSEEIAKEVLQSIKEKPQIKKQIDKNSNLYIPILAVPQNIDNNREKGVTTIEIEIDSEKTKDDFSVEKQLEDIDLRILLFLPNISQIHIVTEFSDIIYKRQIIEDDIKSICLRKIVSRKLEAEECFYVFGKIIPKAIKEDQEEKDILLSIAVPKDFSSFDSKHLYSFFPLLDTDSPFNCIFHASYFLDDHRNTINSNEGNKTIIKEQLDFLIDVADTFIHKGQYECAYTLLVPKNFSMYNWHFPTPFKKFEMENYYLDLLSEQKIFQTVNGENISIYDNLKLIEGDFPKVFIGENFCNLLKSVNTDFLMLLKLLKERKNINIDYSEEEILSIINKETNKWSISNRVDVFIWWNNYRWKSQSLPNLLETQQNKWLRFKDDCYFMVGNMDSITLPVWVNISALKSEYQSALFEKAETSVKITEEKSRDKSAQTPRLISQQNIYPSVCFKYLDKSTIISAVNSSVNNYENAISFVKWLWISYKNEGNEWNPPAINYKFPIDGKNCIRDSKKVYLGTNYNNPLAEKLFDDEYGHFPAPSAFSISNEDKDTFINFIRKFSVKRFPPIEMKEISNPIGSFKEKYKEKINAYHKAYNINYINNIEHILERLSTKDVIKWIIEDTNLYTCLASPMSNDIRITYREVRQKRDHYHLEKDNYLLEVFNESAWIEIKGNRYSPRQVLQSFQSENNLIFAELTPILTTEIIERIAKETKYNVEIICKVFNMFDFCKKVTDLTSDNFYGIMLKLPYLELSQSEKISKSIYRIIEQPSFNKTYKDSNNKTTFFNEGELLVKYHKQVQYYPANKSYLPSSKIIIKNEIPIIEKGQRTNNDNFKRIFGCIEYKKDYSVIKESLSESPANSSFQKYFAEFQKYALAFSERNDNIEKNAKKLTINLVNKIYIEESGEKKQIEEEYMYIRDTMTNWYITVFSNDYNVLKISLIIENIYTNIANTSGFSAEASKIGELFRTNNKKGRDFLIENEFGSLCVIDDKSYSNDIKNNFINTIKYISENYDIETIEINFEKFSDADIQIQNAPVIIKIFKEINTDVEKFKNAGFVYKIDLIPYYKKQLNEFIESEKRKFKDYKYTMAIEDIALQNDFIRIVIDFENFQLSDYENSVYFDVKNKVVEKFGSWDCYKKIVSANEKYAENYDYMNPDKMFEDNIANNTKVQTMIYFYRINEFKDWLSEMQIKQEKENQENIVDSYSQHRDITAQREKIKYNSENKFKNGGDYTKRNWSVTPQEIEKKQRNEKRKGNRAELVIYNTLCKEVGPENVYPRSEAFVELGIIKPGQAVSRGYDLSYRDNTGKEYYIEIKNGDGNHFFISPEELQFAKDHLDEYKLYLVYNINNPTYIELPPKFWEDDKFRRKDIIETIEYKF